MPLEFNGDFSAADNAQFVGELTIEVRVWKREYARLRQRVVELEAELTASSNGASSLEQTK